MITILDFVEKSNLFLVPLDAQGEWFRFHHLFQQAFPAGQGNLLGPSGFLADVFQRLADGLESQWAAEARDELGRQLRLQELLDRWQSAQFHLLAGGALSTGGGSCGTGLGCQRAFSRMRIRYSMAINPAARPRPLHNVTRRTCCSQISTAP